MKFVTAAILSIASLTPASALAQDGPVVVELFTSQGCTSCPPADAILHKLAARDDVIALALHVDYWDYIGWKDEYALASHSQRQRGYAHAAGRNMVYTPQMIVNGVDDVVGAHAMELAEIIDQQKSETAVAVIRATREGTQLRVHAEPLAQVVKGPLAVQLVQYSPLKTAHITRGELAGHDLDYANVVEDWAMLGDWDGSGPFDMTTEIDADRPAVVLIQYPGPGEIIAAVQVD